MNRYHAGLAFPAALVLLMAAALSYLAIGGY